MDQKQIARLKPRDNSSAALRDALALVRDERNAAEQRHAEAHADRADALLTGGKTLADADAAARAAALDLEQLDALRDALQHQHQEARNAEALAALEQQAQAAEEAVERFRAWLATDYLALARQIAAGLLLEQTAQQARTRFLAARDDLSRRGVDVPFIALSALPTVPISSGASSLGNVVRLPAARAGEAAPWMPQNRIGEANAYARDPDGYLCINPAA